MTAPSHLHDSLYREHLEDASFLFEQRLQWLEDPTLELADVARLEERLEAHLDGLVVGSEQAWPRCRDALAHGDSGELHAAITVGCRNDRTELLVPLGDRLARHDESAQRASGLALAAELPMGWCGAIAPTLAVPSLQPVIARAIGYRRFELGDALLSATMQRPEPWTLWALGELRHRPARDRLRVLADTADEPSTRRAATIAALKLGLRDVTSSDPIVCALVDDDAKLAGPVDDDLTVALALRGDARALAMLTELLGEDELAAAAAGALVLVTGAHLFEPDVEPDFAELIGEPEDPTKPSRLRPCRDAAVWREHVRELGDDAPRRMGARATVAASAQGIATLAVPLELRGYLCDELAIRHGVDVALRPDMGARVQLARLDQLQRGAA